MAGSRPRAMPASSRVLPGLKPRHPGALPSSGSRRTPLSGEKQFGLLSVTTWIVAAERLKTPPNELELPLPQSQLDLAAALLAGGV